VGLVARPPTLVLHLVTGMRWHDGVPTTARDVRWTLDAARDQAVGYPRSAELAGLEADRGARRLDCRPPVRGAGGAFPRRPHRSGHRPRDLLDSVPRTHLRQAA
jgi:peptide/nickel transport system substrate-binding protein